MDDAVIAAIQDCIHYRFSQVKLLVTAFTHSSYANERDQATEDNERLEFLGDAVLELCTSAEAFARYPEAPEGQLTKLRARLVKEKTLADLARELGLDEYVLLGRGEESQGGRDRDALLSDTVEALLGAIFLDSGYERACEVISGLFRDRWPSNPDLSRGKDFKSRLQELTQSLFKGRPVYALSESSGPEHRKTFCVQIVLPQGERFEAEGPSLKKAEQNAARKALDYYAEKKKGAE